MTTPIFTFPPQCRNCVSLHERSNDYYDKIDELNNDVIEESIRTERAALAMGKPGALEVESSHTQLKLEAAAYMGNMLHAAIQQEADIAAIFCDGTDDPSATSLLPCRFLESLLK